MVNFTINWIQQSTFASLSDGATCKPVLAVSLASLLLSTRTDSVLWWPQFDAHSSETNHRVLIKVPNIKQRVTLKCWKPESISSCIRTVFCREEESCLANMLHPFQRFNEFSPFFSFTSINRNRKLCRGIFSNRHMYYSKLIENCESLIPPRPPDEFRNAAISSLLMGLLRSPASSIANRWMCDGRSLEAYYPFSDRRIAVHYTAKNGRIKPAKAAVSRELVRAL